MIDTNYTYYLDLQEFKVKLPSEIDETSKKLINILRDDGYKGYKGSRGNAERAITKKEINHLKYALRHSLETDEEYTELSERLSSARAKLPSLTAENYPEWFI